jgi:hypothetical protein
MNMILEALRDGDHAIVDKFVQANELWKRILQDIDTISVEDLAERLHVEQGKFERIANDRYLGKLLCGWTGYTHLYSCQVGFEDNVYKARKLREAIAKSMCSLEVKHASKDAAAQYPLD